MRLHINSGDLDKLLELNSKNHHKMFFADTSGTQACLMNQYIKDVSSMLALIFTVEEQKFELHLAPERELLPKYFAFNHISYSRYLTFQHVIFSEIKHCNGNVRNDYLREGFKGS